MKAVSRSSIFLFAGIGLIGLVFMLNWSWYIYDMDDGSTLAYHLVGRNPGVQPPYSAYDSMCDYLLSFLPASYNKLFGVMVVGTFMASVAIYVLLQRIAAIMNPDLGGSIYLYGFLFLLACPDFFYLTLSYKSSLISFAFLLLSHYFLVRNNAGLTTIFISAIIFGFGVACRWNHIAYGLPIVVHFFHRQYEQYKWQKSWKPMLWGVSALVMFLAFVYLSGYDLQSFAAVMLWGKEYVGQTEYQLTAIAADSVNLFTPVMVMALIAGIFACFRNMRKYATVLFFFAASLPMFFYLGFFPNLKYLLPLLPALFILFVIGADAIVRYTSDRARWLRVATILILITPWFIGARVYTDTTLWGPGFDIKSSVATKTDFGKSLDERISLRNLKVGAFDGFAISTAEGTKPLWGNAYVLLGGKVKQLNTKLGNEVDKVIDVSLAENIPVYTDRTNPLLLAGLCKRGFRTADSATQNGEVTIRTFTNGGQTIVLKRFNSKSDILNFTKIKVLAGQKFVAHFTYSSLMAKFIEKAQRNEVKPVSQIGAFSGAFQVTKDILPLALSVPSGYFSDRSLN